jgi:beta-glucosidase
MGAAFINGVQSQGVGTSLKHYVANNVETQRMWMNSDVDTRTLNEIYLTPFEIAVKKSNPWTVMACYNRVQGIYGTQSPYLLTEVLRDEWGYEGIVISDWFAVVDRVEGVKAGMNIEMPFVSGVNDSLIVEAVKNGTLDEAVLDELVEQILFIVLKAQALEKEGVDQNIDAHNLFAREVAAEAATLLKNDNEILPLTKDKYKKVAIIGEFAKNPRYQGNGSSEVKPPMLANILDVLEEEYGKTFKFSYYQGYNLSDDEDLSLIEEAKNAAEKADIALVFAGLPLQYESEGIDRTHINMPASHNKLISEVASAQANTVVVLTNGSAVAMPWKDEVSGILETWLGGQAGAGGTADVLFGKVNPSGKIAETFPYKLEDTPAYFNFPGEEGNALYGERIFVGYRYYDEKKIDPMFPFGYGLSYTSFEYTDLTVSSTNITDAEGLTVSVKIKNTGKVKGKEVVQLYVADHKSTLIRPKNELKKFAKIELEPGQETEVTFKLDGRDFSYFDSKRNMWIAESGEFTINVGASSRDFRQSKTINLKSTQKVPLAFDEYTFFTEYWDNKQTRELIKEIMPNFVKFWTPEGKTPDDAEVMGFISDHPIIKFPYISKGEITHEQVMELVEACKDLTYTP